MKACESILELTGNTPVVRLRRVVSNYPGEIWAKLEMFNPSGSAKARAALGMILAAENRGQIKPGCTIIEPSSGNQGIGLAMVGAVKGYPVIVVMPDSMSIERQQLVKAYGAEVVLTPAEKDVPGAVEKANELVALHPDSWMPDQFTNPSNPEFHSQTTAQEILQQLGKLDGFVAGVGTGGTLTGVTRVLKEVYPDLKAFAVEPEESAVLNGGIPGPHRVQGIGDGFIPANLDLSLIDGAIVVNEAEAIEMTRRLAREEGILVGVSSGAAVVAAVKAGVLLGEGKQILAVLPDTGERYLSLGIY